MNRSKIYIIIFFIYSVILFSCSAHHQTIIDKRGTLKLTDYSYFIFGNVNPINPKPEGIRNYRIVSSENIRSRVENAFNDMGFAVLNKGDYLDLPAEEKARVISGICYQYKTKENRFPVFGGKTNIHNDWQTKINFALDLYSGYDWVYHVESFIWENPILKKSAGNEAVMQALSKMMVDFSLDIKHSHY